MINICSYLKKRLAHANDSGIVLMIGRSLSAWLALLGFVASVANAAGIDSVVGPPPLKVAEGFTIELVAGPPLVERPITAAFDAEGRLYVGDSSGSNEPVEKQLDARPHRILRLEDTNQDGRFDRSTVFADRMMFPEGTMFYDGSLYVAAPPSIWKLTDADGDGVADKREEWLQGKTLTNCANDLHGPYLGPDGWIYWCKGAFAEQTHEVNGRPWTTHAAHIFRCRPDGTKLEPVMTGGMDNPVDVVFTPAGERLFSATFLVHPSNGQRDGLAHAVYGGVHGKDHGALEGHPRTGQLMPVVLHMGAAAPSGLERYEGNLWGEEYCDNLFLCQFNSRKVSRHVLRPQGSSFATEDHDFITSENVDFHPTDVVADADGSLLVVDTGGWYGFCPTSRLWKPDVLGGIYRIRKVGTTPRADPRGAKVTWKTADLAHLWVLLTDERTAVRQRATGEFSKRRNSKEMPHFLADLLKQTTFSLGATPRGTLSRLWALGQVETEVSRSVVRSALTHSDAPVRQSALQLVSLYRDAEAAPQLANILAGDSPMNRRLAAEALGRIGNRAAVTGLLAAAAKGDDRVLQHSIIFALIELADAQATRVALTDADSNTRVAALIALDQMAGGGLQAPLVVPLLDSPESTLSAAAYWLIGHHPEWGDDLAQWFRSKLMAVNESSPDEHSDEPLEKLLADFAGQPSIQRVLAASVSQADLSLSARKLVLRAMARSKLTPPPRSWHDALTAVLLGPSPELLSSTVTAARELGTPAQPHPEFDDAMRRVAENPKLANEIRVAALATISARCGGFGVAEFDLLVDCFASDRSVGLRSAAADAISTGQLSREQLTRVCDVIGTAGPLELNRLVSPFSRASDEDLGLTLVSSLRDAKALPSLRVDLLREALAKYSPAVQSRIEELHELVNVDLRAQKQRLADLVPRLAEGDVRRGHAVFHSSKAACSACHRLGYAGGTVGPDLTRIGETRTERDLLEAIVFPSLTIVRSFEPVAVVTVDGKVLNGLIRNETSKDLLLATGPNEETRIPRNKVEDIHPSTVSVMPAGLDKQLTVQELADLVVFLKNAKLP